VNVRSIPVCTQPIAEAFSAAQSRGEPVLVPQQFYADDRGWSLMNQLQGVMSAAGQVNYSVTYPGVVKAWHRHDLQTDFWMGLQGNLKVGVLRESDGSAWTAVIGDRRPAVVIIPPPLWHGVATVGDQPAGLLYYVTHAYDAAKPDEERRAADAFAGFPWAVVHR
jgi:dTDP-4-dehydrorhamnose 3,5-epimerase